MPAAVVNYIGPGLRRELAQEHISMIAFSANLGFGFTINSGRILRLVGPGGATLAYVIASLIVVLLISPFVEMASVVNLTGPLWELPTGLVDSVLGPTLGFMFLFTFVTVYPQELVMTAKLAAFDYQPHPSLGQHIPAVKWENISNASPLIWIALAWSTTAAVNLLKIKWYGKCEYVFGAFKLISLVILILAQIAINVAGKVNMGPGETGRTASMQIAQTPPASLQTLSKLAMSSMIPTATPTTVTPLPSLACASALVPIAAPEAEDPRRGLKSANRKSLFRVCVLYCIGIFAVSFNVPYDHPQLRPFQSPQLSTSVNSPIMIAIVESGYIRLAHFTNFFFVFATWSCATSTLFISSRVLYSLAENNKLPFRQLNYRLSTTTVDGVPKNAVYAAALSGLLGFLGAGKKPQMALDALTAIGTNCWLIVFAGLSLTFHYYYMHLRRRNDVLQGTNPAFNRDSGRANSVPLQVISPNPALQNINPNQQYPNGQQPAQLPHQNNMVYAYRTNFQPERAWVGIFICLLMLIFGGWWVWLKPRRLPDEIISLYLAHTFFLFLYAGIRIYRRHYLGPGRSGLVPDNTILLNNDHLFVAAEREGEETGNWWWRALKVVFEWFFW
ncbi:amino acid permease-domain-containing protein [Trichophaea hybrida]|nr:amino acid permease-domain-containing protein [Trichophaea hybrida]